MKQRYTGTSRHSWYRWVIPQVQAKAGSRFGAANLKTKSSRRCDTTPEAYSPWSTPAPTQMEASSL
ncbi:YALI0C15304p [Yarrowia lipolytica CLIB122]|uniref:YALI0C15304p n=1 Tax=Yarrowia lipolytica (strain CLIB 122 / E 150) TaxID=284591 RepID=Q6CBU9_YARLI|nr:YALI0C15304p [Yarrowia lipolytica CLIB122]CAG82176.1 YALI0C15304p [Yarrowia lipolytica CLIB122]|eukprot:XP_501863.1 YALI0C15304p [Yarrowia lipolytica CLIB122]